MVADPALGPDLLMGMILNSAVEVSLLGRSSPATTRPHGPSERRFVVSRRVSPGTGGTRLIEVSERGKMTLPSDAGGGRPSSPIRNAARWEHSLTLAAINKMGWPLSAWFAP